MTSTEGCCDSPETGRAGNRNDEPSQQKPGRTVHDNVVVPSMMVAVRISSMNGKLVVGAIGLLVSAVAVYEFLLLRGLTPST